MAEHFGFLQVLVRTAGESLPVREATVLVEGEGVTERLSTDRSGRTKQISLPAPPASNSLKAGSDAPFALYRVTVEKEGFYKQTTENVPVFAGVVSLQPITLIGLAEYGSDTLSPESSTDTVPSDPQTLNQ
ncbi:MAG: hypothetical protein E7657_06435 [Ruminococcaceae bacterium]|nr:hypothetical protein [Oscillospiraceae bacterium]